VLAVHPGDATALLFLAFPMIANVQAEEVITDLEKTASKTHRSPGSANQADVGNLVSFRLQARTFSANEGAVSLTKQTKVDRCERVRVN
jgi:hypothetical protein